MPQKETTPPVKSRSPSRTLHPFTERPKRAVNPAIIRAVQSVNSALQQAKRTGLKRSVTSPQRPRSRVDLRTAKSVPTATGRRYSRTTMRILASAVRIKTRGSPRMSFMESISLLKGFTKLPTLSGASTSISATSTSAPQSSLLSCSPSSSSGICMG